ncbi:MAG: PaaI family thioesterase [Actinobacteria bacterium]|nr:PaaI family thioesterase [Actinomycetota bacterium]
MSRATRGEIEEFFAAELPFLESFGLRIESVDDGTGVARFVYDERWTRPYGVINGGTLMALADVATYLALFGRLGIVPLAVTNEMKMNFLRPAIGGDVIAAAELLKVGRRIAYATVDLFMADDPDRLIAHATTSYVLPDEGIG